MGAWGQKVGASQVIGKGADSMKPVMVLAGVVFVSLGLIPGQILIGFLRGDAAAVPAGLEAGVMLLRGSAALMGVYLLVLSRFSAAQGDRRAAYVDEAPALAGWLLAGILGVAALLRFHALGLGIWFDEMLMHTGYMDRGPLEILTTFDDSNNHILYTFLARLSIGLFGDTVAAIRLPAVLFGLASIAAIYGFSRRVMSWPEAMVAAALLTVSYHHVWFSQNARGYTALLFFSLLSSSFLIDAIRTGRTGRWLAYALVGAMGAFTHLTIAFLFVGHFIYFAYRTLIGPERKNAGLSRFWTGIFQGFAVLTLLTLVLYATVLPDMLGGTLLTSGLQGKSEWTNPIWALRELLGSLQIGFSGAGVLAAGGLVVLVGMVRFSRTEAAPVAFFVIPVGLAVLIMTSIGYTLFPRFFFFAMGFAIVIVIHGASAFGALAARALRLDGARAGWAAVAPALVLVAASAISLPKAYFPKQSFEQSIAFVEGQLRPDDVVAVIGISDLPYNRYFGKGWARIDTVADLEALLASGKRVWVLYTLPVQVRASAPELLARLESGFTRVETFWGTLGGGEIVVSVSGDSR